MPQILAFQSGHTTYDFRNLVGNGFLTGFVEANSQFAQEFISILGGLIHGGHPGTMLSSVGIQDVFLKLDMQNGWNQLFQYGVLIRFKDVISSVSFFLWCGLPSDTRNFADG